MKLLALPLLLMAAAPAVAQDTLRLPALQQAAVEHDPRARQAALHEAATALRLGNLTAERLPRLTAGAEATYLSEVAAIPIELPGADVPEPPRDRYEMTLGVEQLLYDGGVIAGRRAAERAQLAVEEAAVTAALHPLRAEVNEAFFTAFLLQERLAEIAALTADLEARLAVVRAQVREGAALAGDTAALRAELLRAEQDRDAAEADRRAALAVLAALAGVEIAESDVLALPDLAAEVAQARAAVPRTHPRYAVFEAQRNRLDREAAVIDAQDRPRLSAFGQVGYGRPGFEQFTDELHTYGSAGIRLRWTPWTWGTTARERELLRVRREIVETEEAAFTEQIEREIRDELATIDRLAATLETDDRIVALREQVERQARAQLDERAITPAVYVDARTDLEQARLARQRHRVELARARARYLTTLGIPLR